MIKKLRKLLNELSFLFATKFAKVRFSKISGKATEKRRASARALFEKKWRKRYEMHSLLKEGDTYKLGEATVTLMKAGPEGKQEMKKRIAEADARRAKRREELTKKGEEMMLLPPEELLKYQVDEWIQKNKEFQKNKRMKKLTKKESAAEPPPPPGDKKTRARRTP
jgi:hypothetical protein